MASKPSATADPPDGKNSPMEKTFLALATLAAMAVPAWATMPPLGEKPPMRTDAACWAWAEEQAKDEEVAFMWGILDDGNSDRAVAVRAAGRRLPRQAQARNRRLRVQRRLRPGLLPSTLPPENLPHEPRTLTDRARALGHAHVERRATPASSVAPSSRALVERRAEARVSSVERQSASRVRCQLARRRASPNVGCRAIERRAIEASTKAQPSKPSDTTTPHGRLMATFLDGIAEFERELIVSRTSDRRRSGDANAPRNSTPRSAAATMSAAGRSGGCKYETDSAYLSSAVGGLGAP